MKKYLKEPFRVELTTHEQIRRIYLNPLLLKKYLESLTEEELKLTSGIAFGESISGKELLENI